MQSALAASSKASASTDAVLSVAVCPCGKHCGAMDDGLARLNVSRKTETMGSQRNNVQSSGKLTIRNAGRNRPRWRRTFRRSSAGNARSSLHVRKPRRSATGLRVLPAADLCRAPRRLVRRVGDRKLRRGRRHSAIRSVPVSVPDHDRVRKPSSWRCSCWRARTACRGKPTNAVTSTCKSTSSRSER